MTDAFSGKTTERKGKEGRPDIASPTYRVAAFDVSGINATMG